MRNAFPFSLPLAIIAAAGCGSQPKEQAARSDLERDLTLVSRAPDKAVASPLELREVRSQPRKTVDPGNTIHKAARVVRHRPARHVTTRVADPVRPAPPAPAVVADVSVPGPAASVPEAVPADSHELPPGKTVSVIPASSGPSTAGSGPEDIPVMVGTGGSGMGGGGSGMGGGGSGMGGGGSGMGGGGSGMGGGGSGMGGGGSGMGGDWPGGGARPRGTLY